MINTKIENTEFVKAFVVYVGEIIMGKNKPRHNSNKKQNEKGNFCQYYEEYASGCVACEGHVGDAKVCKGNPHNCIKTLYKRATSRSNTQINNGDFKRS